MPKIDFSHFDSTDARIWLDKCEAYFALYQISLGFRVSATSIHMSGPAAHWFKTYQQVHGFQHWEQFASVVVSEFEIDTHHAKTMELLNLKQTREVEELRRDFGRLVYRVRLYDAPLSNTMLIAQFILGLKEELKFVVEM
jgi:hypothetical protein